MKRSFQKMHEPLLQKLQKVKKTIARDYTKKKKKEKTFLIS